jgi:hypothetical protein
MDEDFMTNEIARILLRTITGRDPPKNDSDHSYIMSLCPGHRDGESSTYTYLDNLPPGDIFVDRIGWMPSEEVARYLMMGYRVWDENGRRLHFHGTPLQYDSLNVFRFPHKIICSQDVSEVPDLQVQIEAGLRHKNPAPGNLTFPRRNRKHSRKSLKSVWLVPRLYAL